MKPRITVERLRSRTIISAMVAVAFCYGSALAQSPAPGSSTAPAAPAAAPPANAGGAPVAEPAPGKGSKASGNPAKAAAAERAAERAAQAAQSAAALAPFAWLQGCWDGNVNGREFREQWLPLEGDMMIGASQTVIKKRMSSFEFLRLEMRDDKIHYVTLSQGKTETAFRFVSQTTVEDAEVFAFDNTDTTVDFPQHLSYRRGKEGWLYATVDGQVKGHDRPVVFPMRRVDCKSGAILAE